MKRRQYKLNMLLILSAMSIISCTDLEIEETDSIIDQSTASGSIFDGVEDPASSVNNLFDGLRSRYENQENFYAMQEVASDEFLVPTRGTDWGDNGIWRTLHTHNWDPGHLFILRAWNDWNQSIFLASEVIDPRSNGSAEEVAQAKFIRALGMWVIMDAFGQVPLRGVDEGPEVNPAVSTAPEAYALILQDLDDAIADLPSTAAMDQANLNRASKAAARFLKARVLLNSGTYLGTGTADAAALNEVVTLVDAIADDGFALQSGYFDIFKEDADTETILWTPSSVGNNIFNGLHYNTQALDGTGGWNGFSTLAEFYDSFEGAPNTNYVGDGQEERRGWVPDATNANEENTGIAYGFFIGQAYDKDGKPLTDRPGNPLVFTKDFPGLVGNNERTGVRVIKYHPANGSFTNHKILFRYADAHLMKAEAILRGATGGDATALVNELRTIRQTNNLIGSVTLEDILAERGRELYGEMIRRTDMIRFGTFSAGYEFMDEERIGDETRNLFSIPSNALLSNPNLVQNPGY
ncbi:RagB/SusD family nutrient uptake outer membrane protein [Maribacter litoralis]|uniref:RagB/SusD family nutrient uptake outer membrane protein n=1 Tax=Maribacter litoralis TaxID=2059726 RepID=UPI000E312E0E|nr:RagB/SusD family nutrient uptake outer membrane protein [Maribacter litoralis]